MQKGNRAHRQQRRLAQMRRVRFVEVGELLDQVDTMSGFLRFHGPAVITKPAGSKTCPHCLRDYLQSRDGKCPYCGKLVGEKVEKKSK
jgi:predicted Zn-ribbon and HTH transcriptional regulator